MAAVGAIVKGAMKKEVDVVMSKLLSSFTKFPSYLPVLIKRYQANMSNLWSGQVFYWSSSGHQMENAQ
jgi:hypothetical protein